GKVDTVLMKLIDTQMAYPGILIALMLISIFGTGVRNVIISLGVMSIPRFARITRAGFIQYKSYDFVKAARARGANSLRVMYIHILPNILSSLAVTCSLAFANSILLEAGLSYLGLGIQPPAPSWGMMLKEAQSFIYNSVTYAIGPGIMVTAMVLGFNLIGDGLRDVLDTRL
ncbi:MAG: ABC transporter permease, partial [Eubacteriales bacterium]|nr:ABC transporter permease [Eubacteriales bacterium]